MKFHVTGHIELAEKRKFSKTVEAKTEGHAREQVYALFGQQNGLRRNDVHIDKVGEK